VRGEDFLIVAKIIRQFFWIALPVSSALAIDAIPFVFDPLTSADAARPAAVSMFGEVAAVIEPGLARSGFSKTNNFLCYYRTNATDWAEIAVVPQPGRALSVDVDNCRVAVGLSGTALVYTVSCSSSKPDCTLSNTIGLGNGGYQVVDVDLEGTRLALLVDKRTGYIGDEEKVVQVYDEVGPSWILRAEVGVGSTSDLFGIILNADAVDLDGDRLALSSLFQNTIQIHEKNQGGANAWGKVASISNQPPGMTYLGFSLALGGTRLAASCLNASNNRPHLLVYSNNVGGVGNWGYAGELLHQPSGAGFLLLDYHDGRLAAMGLPVFNQLVSIGSPGHMWMFNNGAGPAGWTLERNRAIGRISMSYLGLLVSGVVPLPGISLYGTRLMVGLANTNTYQDKSGWAASVHSVNTGGSTQWGSEYTIEAPGVPEQFGYSVDMDGNYMVTGMPNDNWAGVNSGSAYVWYLFDLAGQKAWYPIARLINENGASGHLFGFDVSITTLSGGDALVAVGAWGEFTDKGAVYIFRVSISTGQTTLPVRITPTPYPNGTIFGYSVSLDGDILAVGAPLGDMSGPDWGTVYVFDRNSGGADKWGCIATNPAPNGNIFFGGKVSLENDTLAVTRPSLGTNRAVFIYNQNTGGADKWGLTSSVYPPPGSPNQFADSVAVNSSGSAILIGATHATAASNGHVYIYAETITSGVYNVFHTINDPAGDGPSFGSSVSWASIAGVLVGSSRSGASTGGTARLFGLSFTGGVINVSLLGSMMGSPDDRLGTDVAGGDAYAVAGAPQNDMNGTNAGQILSMRVGSYEVWAGSQPAGFATAWKPWENWDGDADANLMEFAMGTDPMNSGSNQKLVMNLHRGSATNMAWIEPDLAYSTVGLHYNMQSADNLDNWNSIGFDYSFTNSHLRLYDAYENQQQYRLAPLYPVFTSEGGGGGIIIVE